MTQPKYCQGPKCHEYRTKDRIRGPKGDKHYETRRRCHLAYGDEWCSMICYNDWLNEYGTRAVDHFGRTIEAKRTGCDAAWYKDYDYSYNPTGSSRINHRFVNDLLGKKIPITEAQYNDKTLTTPTR